MSAETVTTDVLPARAALPDLAASAADEVEILTVIEHTGGWRAVNLQELWRYRELAQFLIWRDVKVRYRQAVLGIAWAIVQPMTQIILFTVVFGRLAGLGRDTGGVPYPVFLLAGMLPWTLFSSSVSRGGQSIVSSAGMVKKVYFPRLIVPISTIGVASVDFAIQFALLGVLMACFAVLPSVMLPVATLYLALLLLFALGLGAFLSALTVRYRDFNFVIPFAVQMGMYATPIVFSVEAVPEKYRWIVYLNPLSAIVDGFRKSIVGGLSLADTAGPLAWSVVATAGVLWFGLSYFRRVESEFADIV